jgi:hypothetical protein
MVDALHWLFLASDVWLALGIVFALRVRARERAVLGEIVAREMPSPRTRILGSALILAGAVCAVLGRGELGLQWTLPPLALALASALLRPLEQDRVAGRNGVRRGWYVRALADLEEWRLTGDHLRFRLRGLWEAVPLPTALHPEFEARLRALAPERESRFK